LQQRAEPYGVEDELSPKVGKEQNCKTTGIKPLAIETESELEMMGI
jgi:hypothetical protein